MSFLLHGTFLRSFKYANQIIHNQSFRGIIKQYAAVNLSFNLLVYNCRQEHFCSFLRTFHTSQEARLKTLFNEDQQKKIINFINESEQGIKLRSMKLRCLNKVIDSIPENGPLNDLDDLLGKYSLSAPSAIHACYCILESLDKPKEVVVKEASKKVPLSRKARNLQKSITPQISNPVAISKFAAVVITESFISFAVLEGQGAQTRWESQKLCSWNVHEVLDKTCLPEVVGTLWTILPDEDVFVVYTIPTRSSNFLKKYELYGATVSVICAKNNFKADMMKSIFHVSGRAPAREFNFVVNNEIVSPLNIVSNIIDNQGAPNSSDHVFGRSLAEVSFEDNCIVGFREFTDDLREPLCQSLLLGKTFVELLKELQTANKS